MQLPLLTQFIGRISLIRRIRTLLYLLALFIVLSPVYAQEKDFGIWYCFDGEFRLAKKLELDISGNIRTFNNASSIEQIYGEIGLNYKPLKFLSLAGSYRLTGRSENDNDYHPRHKFFADIIGEADISRFTISGRFRLQRQDKTYYEDADDEVPDYHGRIRAKLTYRTPSFPVNPFVTSEIFVRMFETTEKRLDKFRITAGAEYKFSKHHSAELEYIFERDYLPDFIDTNIIALTYNLKF